jgi:undecaprenyl-diphosphatase
MSPVINYLDNLEIGLCLRINRLGRANAVRAFFAAVSRLGDWGFWVAMGPVLLVLQGRAALPAMVHLGVTAGIGVALYKLLKKCLVRERPFVFNGTILCGTAPLDKYSFPSGHTLHAVSLTIMLAHVEPSLLAICAPFALLVAVSRVVLGLHYPSDVVVGAGIGALLANLSIAWM